MATERQIAANRANALRSTGPRSPTGRSKSSRNAYRHGLSLGLAPDASLNDKVDDIARALVTEGAEAEKLKTAQGLVEAQLRLLRIRALRKDLANTINLASGDVSVLGRLLALDRYERYALTQRSRARKKICQNEANFESKEEEGGAIDGMLKAICAK